MRGAILAAFAVACVAGLVVAGNAGQPAAHHPAGHVTRAALPAKSPH